MVNFNANRIVTECKRNKTNPTWPTFPHAIRVLKETHRMCGKLGFRSTLAANYGKIDKLRSSELIRILLIKSFYNIICVLQKNAVHFLYVFWRAIFIPFPSKGEGYHSQVTPALNTEILHW